MTAERIAVTGVGMVSALGANAQLGFERLLRSESGLGPLSLFDPGSLPAGNVGEVRDLRPSDVAPAGHAEHWSRTDALALLAAREALANAGLREARPMGLALGGTTGSMFETERVLFGMQGSAPDGDRARRLLDFPLSTTTARLSRSLPSIRRSATLCSACSSGALAIALGATWLLSGREACALVGGADGLCRMTWAGFHALGAVDPGPCRPFDRARAGLNLAEGAAFLVLERETDARRRGARIWAWLTGWALGAEAHHVTQPEPQGQRASALMREALACAALDRSELDYVHAHGTATRQNDAMEALALERVLGPEARRVRVSSSKGQLGHTLGASGALGAVVSVLALAQGHVPPTLGLSDPEQPGLGHVPALSVRAPLRSALVNSFGFAGASAVLVFEAAARDARPAARPAHACAITASLGAGGGDPLAALDPARSRRFGRASALACWAGERAAVLDDSVRTRLGVSVGNAYGDVERSVRFLKRLGEGRATNPAEFPQLVASALSGNASIYLGLGGPALNVAELDGSAEAALSAAACLVEVGAAPGMLVLGVEAFDPLVEGVMASAGRGPRGEGGAALLLESRAAAEARGAPVLALLGGLWQWPLSDAAALPEVAPRDPARALLLTGALDAALRSALESSVWSRAERVQVPHDAQHHEAVGALALAEGVAKLTGAGYDEVLIVRRGLLARYATHLIRAARRA